MTQSSGKHRFNLNRAEVVDENFVALVESLGDDTGGECASPDAVVDAESGLTAQDVIELFESQMVARHMDIEARRMRARNEGFYTIASAGHEGNAVVGRLTRHTDLAFIHYRSGAFMAERARKVPGTDIVADTLLGCAASREDPTSGGRHKVWGSRPLWVPPQTSTIASHLPKAVGAAMTLARATRLGVESQLPDDSIVVCSFGDASVNHAVAQTAFNAAARAAHVHLPVPILFVCEDNGIGISVKTPTSWIESLFRGRHGFHYVQGDGLNLFDAFRNVAEAVELCRRLREPVFCHLKVVRLLGHAGSDAETEYHTWQQIEQTEAKDPLLTSAKLLVERGLMSPKDILARYESIRKRVQSAAVAAAKTSKLESPEDIMAPMAPSSPKKVASQAGRLASEADRAAVFGGVDRLPESGLPRHMAVLINQGLHDLMLQYPEAILFGEDVAKKGGVYHVTTGLSAQFGNGRCFNTVLDETSILGVAIGAAHLGLLPIPEIQYLAYYHNAEDQIRGEASSLQFFSNDQFRNPMVIRIAGWAYQKGFGGHFHNDNSIAALRDVPGLVIASPSRGDDAVKMMRTCLAMAKVDGRVIAFIEPIALYMTKDLHEPKDQRWSFAYPPPGEAIPLGEGAVYRSEGRKGKADRAEDLTIITFANGMHMSLRAAKTLRDEHDVTARVVDLRWLNPLNEGFIVEQALATGRVLVVDEGRRTGGVAESVLAVLYETCGTRVHAARLNALDTFIPLGPAADSVLPVEKDIIAHALRLLSSSKK